ncbi:MAG TPA: Uma2 family endonuclease [Blastocatellia bacterium]|nr:Uma2 family endonuclease [Blastocatellia bacterium]
MPDYCEVIEHLPPDSTLILRHIDWEEYEALLEEVGENRGLRLSYDQRTLQITTLSSEHEFYATLIERLVNTVSLRLRINIRSFGSMTMKTQQHQKGTEPDACYYIQSAPLTGNRVQSDFNQDPPPDLVVEIDLHHESLSKFPIYAALGVPEIWRYDGRELAIHSLQQSAYVEVEASPALPQLTSRLLTELMTRSREEGEFQTLLGFEEWLNSQQS